MDTNIHSNTKQCHQYKTYFLTFKIYLSHEFFQEKKAPFFITYEKELRAEYQFPISNIPEGEKAPKSYTIFRSNKEYKNYGEEGKKILWENIFVFYLKKYLLRQMCSVITVGAISS